MADGKGDSRPSPQRPRPCSGSWHWRSEMISPTSPIFGNLAIRCITNPLNQAGRANASAGQQRSGIVASAIVVPDWLLTETTSDCLPPPSPRNPPLINFPKSEVPKYRPTNSRRRYCADAVVQVLPCRQGVPSAPKATEVQRDVVSGQGRQGVGESGLPSPTRRRRKAWLLGPARPSREWR